MCTVTLPLPRRSMLRLRKAAQRKLWRRATTHTMCGEFGRRPLGDGGCLQRPHANLRSCEPASEAVPMRGAFRERLDILARKTVGLERQLDQVMETQGRTLEARSKAGGTTAWGVRCGALIVGTRSSAPRVPGTCSGVLAGAEVAAHSPGPAVRGRHDARPPAQNVNPGY